MSLVVLGSVETRRRSGLQGVMPYVSSLRAVAPDVRVVWFSNAVDDAGFWTLADNYGIELVNAETLDRTLGIQALRSEDRRFLEYAAWLAVHPHDQVIVSDVFDVIWQRHPRELPYGTRGLLVTEERVPVSGNRLIRHVLRTFWPDPLAAHLCAQITLCCGAFAGSGMAMADYLAFYASRFPALTMTERGWDTACLFAWVHGQNRAHPTPWLNPHIMHLGFASPESVLWVDGHVEVEGVTPTIVHQYLGFPAIVDAVRATWT